MKKARTSLGMTMIVGGEVDFIEAIGWISRLSSDVHLGAAFVRRDKISVRLRTRAHELTNLNIYLCPKSSS